jgi:hypothetical protein
MVFHRNCSPPPQVADRRYPADRVDTPAKTLPDWGDPATPDVISPGFTLLGGYL